MGALLVRLKRVPQRHGLFLAVAAAMLASAILVIARTRQYYFFSDDFLNFIIASDMGLSWRYLFRDLFGQFVPLYRLAYLLYWHVFGLRFWPVRVACVLFAWFVICVLARLAWRRNVGVLATWPMLLFLACSPVFVTTWQWWSAALSVLTSAMASLACISLVAQDEAPGLPRKLAVATCFLVGLLFYPKGLFTIILLLAVRLFFRAANGRPGIWLMLLGSLRDVWPTLVVIPAYLSIVRAGHYSSGVVRPDVATLAQFIWAGWNGGFLTATLGLHYGTAGLAAANLLVFAMVAWSILRAPARVILWGGFGLYFIVSIGVVGWNRAVPFGIGSAETGRYYADILCFFAAMLLIGLGRSAGAPRTLAWPGLAVVGAVTAMGALLLVDAGGRVPHLWYAGPERPAAFVANMRRALTTAGDGTVIADGAVPAELMPRWMAPLNRYGLFVRLFGWRGEVVAGQGATCAFDQEGHLVPRE